MNRRRSVVLAAAVVGVALLSPAPGAGPFAGPPGDTVLARVGDDVVTTGDLQAALVDMGRPPAGAGASVALAPEDVLRRLIQNRLLEQEGYRMGADQDPMVRNQVLDLIQRRAMIALLDSVQAQVPDPGPAASDSVLDRPHSMHRLSHILVADRDQAEALLDSLDAGVPFADLADRHSLDSTWAAPGGDLGWAGAGRFIPEFEAVLPGMTVGDVAGPIRTEEGWHLLTLTEIHTETAGQSDPMKQALRDARMQQEVMQAMDAYLASLKERYGVVVNEALLSMLDYGSEDPAVQAELRTSEAVLATLPGRNLTVKGLTFKIRFQYFHGTEGKPNADQIRDQVFQDWLAESLFRHEAMARGFQNKPAIVAAARKLERRLVREHVLETVADIKAEASPQEVAAYYNDHPDAFASPARIKAEGVFLSSEGAARSFRDKLEQGAAMGWLAERTPEVVNPRPPMFSKWMDPGRLGISGEGLTGGTLAGPVLVDGAWAVARVVQVEPPTRLPLRDCRARVVKMLRAEKRHDAVSRALALLESGTSIEVDPAAQGIVEKHVNAWLAGASPGSLD